MNFEFDFPYKISYTFEIIQKAFVFSGLFFENIISKLAVKII